MYPEFPKSSPELIIRFKCQPGKETCVKIYHMTNPAADQLKQHHIFIVSKYACCAPSLWKKLVFVNVSRINYRQGRIHTWLWNLQPPAVLCRKKCADYFKYRVVFFSVHSLRFYFFIFCIIQALLSTISASTINKEGAHMQPSVL